MRNTCKDCSSPVYGFNLCHQHLGELQKKDFTKEDAIFLTHKKCVVEGCNRIVYAKKMCRKHYTKQLNLFTKKTTYQLGINKCKFCGVGIKSSSEYCTIHKNQLDKSLPLGNTLKGYALRKGTLNPRWSGGNFYYHNHGELKRNRKLRINHSNGLCEFCLKTASKIAVHVDGNKDNHSFDNIRMSCLPCRSIFRKTYKEVNNDKIK